MIRAINIAFWLIFFGLFLWMIIPKFQYLSTGIPVFMGKDSRFEKGVFTVHIFSGALVYITVLFQFSPSVRKRYISFHRATGKLSISASLICISTLFIMIPDGLCAACRPSQYIVTSLWLLFISLAWYFIRQGNVKLHQRLMICAFICAAYFVTVRVVDRFAMGLFRDLFSTESGALLVSDISVWLIPLSVFGLYWFINARKRIDYAGKK